MRLNYYDFILTDSDKIYNSFLYTVVFCTPSARGLTAAPAAAYNGLNYPAAGNSAAIPRSGKEPPSMSDLKEKGLESLSDDTLKDIAGSFAAATGLQRERRRSVDRDLSGKGAKLL